MSFTRQQAILESSKRLEDFGLLGVGELGEFDNNVSYVPGIPGKFSKEYGETSPVKMRIVK